MYWTVATINFNQSTYTVTEDNGYVYPVLVLSKPYEGYNLRIGSTSRTASGELIIYNNCIQIINNIILCFNYIFKIYTISQLYAYICILVLATE